MKISPLAKIPARVVAPILITAPVVIVVFVLSFIAFNQGRRAVNDLAAQNLSQIHERITDRFDALFDAPARIHRVNAHLIREGRLDTSDLRSWRKTYFEQSQAVDELSGVLWGSADGRVVWVIRYPDGKGYVFGVRDEETGDEAHEFALDEHGAIPEEPTARYVYDPRSRPWYQAAMEAGGPTWTEPYAWINSDGTPTRALGISFAEPLWNEKGELLGVLDAELSLHDISRFLATLSIGETGRAYVSDPDGLLIAASSGAAVMDRALNRIPAADSPDPYVAATVARLQERFSSSAGLPDVYQDRLEINDEPHLLMVSRYEGGPGLSWLIATLVPERDFMAQIDAGRSRSVFAGGVAIGLTLLFGFALSMIAVRPFLTLVGEVEKIGEGELDHEIDLAPTPEFAQLSKAINTMTAGLRDHLKLRQSLSLAMDVQQSLLPSEVPKVEGLDLAGHCTYCDETGGDYYDFLDMTGLSTRAVSIAVGDVVGHGVAAAMLMANARGILRSHSQASSSLGGLLTHLNDLLVEDISGQRFMTMLLMTIDTENNVMRWASAGHGAPIVYDAQDDRFIELEGGGIPLGIMRERDYKEHPFDGVRFGQIFLATTDGLWETFNEDREMFGMDRLRDLIRVSTHLSAAEIGQRITDVLRQFRGASSQDDDITFVIAKVL